MALLTLFMGVGLERPQVLTLYMLGWKGLVLGIPKKYHVSLVAKNIQWIEKFLRRCGRDANCKNRIPKLTAKKRYKIHCTVFEGKLI